MTHPSANLHTAEAPSETHGLHGVATPRLERDERGWVGELQIMSHIAPEVSDFLLDELEKKFHLTYSDYLQARELLLELFEGNSATMEFRLTCHAHSWLCASLYGATSAYATDEQGSTEKHASNSHNISREIHRTTDSQFK